ncbi:hypothetical protein COT94_02535 [Candidatus Falkowbacteria bacterium CG10_big_fil_rev_8_21_14_0_10_37_14]|uniref:DSBA-like thioredoxin domain-containing protein n=1 Tax=Candidatus Falkowbacteria bacterium CG10_big_fil_rev_8_21_14_0_10_37_14 TaxID=1974561 RepID=A0A2M6WTM3_9BACT|nr:thioredoxin domain-containing protein [Candidatus Falkowbacteria bacterium]PIT96111.1 MAG: hypothetical protein COT94_02535 [Candidatus Falkowbacteria bacterium CG10_big_fil_rev_8_21_14_0_10_37_14]
MKLWQLKKDQLSVKEFLKGWWWLTAIVLIAVVIVAYQILIVNEIKRTKWNKLLATNNVGAELASSPLKPIPGFSKDDIISGNSSAKARLIMYIDFTCPFSAELFQTLKLARAEHGDNLAIAWRMFPLAGQQDANSAATAFICVAKQGYTDQMMEKLFSMQVTGEFAPAKYRQVALELGVKLDNYDECVESAETLASITVQKNEAEMAGVIGTPHTFTVHGNYPGALPMEDFTDSLGVKRPGLKSIVDKMLLNK